MRPLLRATWLKGGYFGALTPSASIFGLGCVALPFDTALDSDVEVARTIRQVLRLGINLIDTSVLYVKGCAEIGVSSDLDGVYLAIHILSMKVSYVMDAAAIAKLLVGGGIVQLQDWTNSSRVLPELSLGTM